MITDVSVSSPVPGGYVDRSTDEWKRPRQVITDVYSVCNAENVRPLTDTVIVSARTRGLCAHGGRGAVRRRRCRDRAGASITSALEDFAEEKRAKLGLDIIRSHIAQACRLSSVYDVTVVAPAANLIISDEQFRHEITVNVTGFSRG